MSGGAYYSENDPHAAQWLRNLISAGAIAPGEVDESDIRDIVPSHLSKFTQVHCFAGVGVWSYALRRAGWSDSRPVWTGSCPCQPFSAAGRKGGLADERHLWPAFHWLIHQCRPETIFGEQVASKDGLAWLDLVCADLEGTGYAGWVGDLCAAGFGDPQIRQRLYFVAQSVEVNRTGAAGHIAAGKWREYDQPNAIFVAGSDSSRRTERRFAPETVGHGHSAFADGDILGMASTEGERLLGRANDGDERRRQRASGQGCEAGELGDAGNARRGPWRGPNSQGENWRGASGPAHPTSQIERPGPTNGFWRDADWIGCTDGKWRPVEPESFPLVDGSAFRMGSGGAFENKSRAKMLKGYGNAIVAEQAAEFIRAYMESV